MKKSLFIFILVLSMPLAYAAEITANQKQSFTKFKGIWDSESSGFAQAVTIKGPTRRIYIAGQASIAEDISNGIIILDPYDKPAQMTTAFNNITKILKQLKASWDDVVQCNLLIKDYDPNQDAAVLLPIWSSYMRAEVASSLYGVSALAFEGMVVEVDCIAEVPLI